MSKVNIPATPDINTTIYSRFKGVSLTDPYLCDEDHSPYSLNLISNNEGMPEIRNGWRILHTLSGSVRTLAHGNIDGTDVFLAHAGTKLYKWTDTTPTEISTALSDAKSMIFFAMYNNKSVAWIVCNGVYLMYDGTTVVNVDTIATIPVILIAKTPAGGGTAYQPVNLLQPKRTEKFRGDGSSMTFQLSANSLDNAIISVTQVLANGTTSISATVNQSTGLVTFATAPPVPPVAGTDNIFITYSKTVTGYADRVKKCTIQTEYGETGNGRIFVAGNTTYRNYDWWSELNDPAYFPDLNYGVTGSSSTAIMGYSKTGRYMLIIKEDNQQDTTIFLRYPATTTAGLAYFKIEPGVTGTGGIASGTFVNLVDEPLFLSRTGVFAVASNNVTAERTLQNRSFFVDEQLTKEENLKDAIATEWNGYYILSLNGKVYAFNSRSKVAHGTSFVYDCFYWNNISATCLMAYSGSLYFGDSSGRICKMNTDLVGNAKYNDNGLAINVVWTTKLDNDGIPYMLKTMQKKGSGITTKPFLRSTYEVYVVTEATELERIIKSFNRDIFDLNDIDLNRFSLESSPFAKFTPFKKKIKKYESMQIVVKASAINEGFGIYNIAKQWIPVNFVKR